MPYHTHITYDGLNSVMTDMFVHKIRNLDLDVSHSNGSTNYGS